jgi:acyl carrier protein
LSALRTGHNLDEVGIVEHALPLPPNGIGAAFAVFLRPADSGGELTMHESQVNSCSLEDQVITVVADALGREREEIQTESSLMGQLGANSIDLVDLAFRLEQTFGIELDTNRLINPISGAAEQHGPGEVTVARVVELVRQAKGSSTRGNNARRLEFP